MQEPETLLSPQSYLSFCSWKKKTWCGGGGTSYIYEHTQSALDGLNSCSNFTFYLFLKQLFKIFKYTKWENRVPPSKGPHPRPKTENGDHFFKWQVGLWRPYPPLYLWPTLPYPTMLPVPTTTEELGMSLTPEPEFSQGPIGFVHGALAPSRGR